MTTTHHRRSVVAGVPIPLRILPTTRPAGLIGAAVRTMVTGDLHLASMVATTVSGTASDIGGSAAKRASPFQTVKCSQPRGVSAPSGCAFWGTASRLLRNIFLWTALAVLRHTPRVPLW